MRLIWFAAFALLAAPAGAAWHRASSPHFIIYGDEAPAKLHAFAEKLERFDKAVQGHPRDEAIRRSATATG